MFAKRVCSVNAFVHQRNMFANEMSLLATVFAAQTVCLRDVFAKGLFANKTVDL